MGVPPKDTVPGNDCLRCFAANETPETILIFTSGIEESPHFSPSGYSPPNGYCYCHQTAIACEWQGHNEKFWRAFVQFKSTESCVSIEVANGYFAFNKCVPSLCFRTFANAKQDPYTFQFYGGFATVMTPEEILDIAETVLGPLPEDVRFEVVPNSISEINIRVASLKQRLNMIIQVPAL